MSAPTLLGHVGAVTGAQVSVKQFVGLTSGIAIIGGRSYRVGQVGSFVRIPQGYHDLYGIISDVGATATPEAAKDRTNSGERWMTIQLVGEIIDVAFERGISQHPAVNDEVHLVVEQDLAKIYGSPDNGQVVVGRLVGAILNVIYQALFWGRELPDGGRARPQLIVMEEAHRYLNKDGQSPAREMVQRIVKEGRKFGVGAMVVSQRPSEVDDTILSQCGTFFALRLSNSSDRSRVQASLPDNLSGVVDSLPILRTGEAIIIGEAARLPVRCRVTLPPVEERPQSGDPPVATAWGKPRAQGDYDRLVAAWRSQNPRWEPPAQGGGDNGA
jgi:hypothetical protein